MSAICEKCGKPIESKFGTGRFCSRACANSRTRSKESKQKTSESLKGHGMNFEQYVDGTKELYLQGIVPRKRLKYYSIDMVYGIDFVTCPYCQLRVSHLQQKHLITHQKTKADVLREFGDNYLMVCENVSKKKSAASYDVQHKLLTEHKHIGWQSRNMRSYAEQFWCKILETYDIKYQTEYVVHKRDLGVDDSSNYFLDFLIDGYIDLEIDGKQHLYEDRAESDRKRDELISNHGFLIYRIPWVNPTNDYNKAIVKQQIDDFLSWYKTMKTERNNL